MTTFNEQHPALTIAHALGHRDALALETSVQTYNPIDALEVDENLCIPIGRAHMEQLLDSGLPADHIRDALLSTSSSADSYHHLAAGMATASIAACQGRPDLTPRAGEVAVSLIATLPPDIAEGVHIRSIYHLARLQAIDPERMNAPVSSELYPAIEHACSLQSASIEKGFLDPDRDPTLTPAGMASLCDFKPALSSLARSLPVESLEDGYSRLAHEVAFRSHGSTPMKNISSAFAYCHEIALDHEHLSVPQVLYQPMVRNSVCSPSL